MVAFCVSLGGTLLGLIYAFKAVGNVDAAHKQEYLSQSISRAMNFTAFGIVFDVLVLVVLVVLTVRQRVRA